MRILSQLKVLVALSLCGLIAMSYLLISSLMEFRDARSENLLVSAIQNDVFSTTYLGNQYFLYSEERTRIQWNDKSQKAANRIAEALIQFHEATDIKILLDIQHNLEESKAIFLRIIANKETLDIEGQDDKIYEELNKRLLSQLLVKSSLIHDNTNALRDSVERRVNQTYKQLVANLILVTLILALIITATIFFITRLIRARLKALHEGAKIVASGQLDFRLECKGSDELTEVAKSINDMTEKLQGITSNLETQLAERNLAEHQLRMLYVAIEHSQTAIMITDLKGNLQYVNPTFTKVTGYGAEEVIGQNISLLQKGLSDETTHIEQWNTLSKGQAWHGELLNRRKNGEIYWEEGHISPVMNANGDITHYVGVKFEITERKRTEQALKQAKEFAEHLARSKSEFLANMSHEIRTPMNGIMGLTQLALNEPASPKLRDYLHKILGSSQSLLGILNEILDFSKLEAERMRIENAPFELDIVLNDLRNLFEEYAQAKQLEFKIETSQDTPQSLIGDALRIRQILSNLIGNAIKFTEKGSVLLKVSLKQIENSKARLAFSVEDTGIGINQNDLNKLFQPFSQVDGSITRRFGGTGLGLAISQRLLNLMGSEFNVSSHAHQGSVFGFELLLDIAEAQNAHDPKPWNIQKTGELAQNLEKIGQNLHDASILIAEDNAINQMVVCQFLKHAGMKATVANNGQETLEILEQQDFDAILMDIHMPVMGGIETTQKIRSNPSYQNLPIIALTADVIDEERQKCIACGMNDFIAKPVNPQALINTLSRWVKLSPPKPAQASESGSGLAALPGFDFSSLWILLDGNETLLRQLLIKFKEDHAHASAEIKAMIENNDLSGAIERIHQIKGTSGNLGAKQLHAAAQTLEAGLKAGRFEAGAFASFEEEFNKTLATIATIQTGQT